MVENWVGRMGMGMGMGDDRYGENTGWLHMPGLYLPHPPSLGAMLPHVFFHKRKDGRFIHANVIYRPTIYYIILYLFWPQTKHCLVDGAA